MSSYEERKQRKEWFLDEMSKTTYEDKTIAFIRATFNSLEFEEEVFDKDVSEFSDAEAIDYLKSLNSTSRISLTNKAWYISKYHEWCYNKGLITNINDPFDSRVIDRIVNEIVSSDIIEQKIIKEDYFKECVETLQDNIDKFILICLYYGVRDDEYVSMRNLKMTDLDEVNKKITLISGRELHVNDYFIEHMKNAYNTEIYIQKEGAQSRNPRQSVYVKNDYIIRSTASVIKENDQNPVKEGFITRRLVDIRKTINDDSFYIRNISKNGMINYIKQKYAEDNISLSDALLKKNINNTYMYDTRTQEYINEFGEIKKTVRMLRMEMKQFIDKY